MSRTAPPAVSRRSFLKIAGSGALRPVVAAIARRVDGRLRPSQECPRDPGTRRPVASRHLGPEAAGRRRAIAVRIGRSRPRFPGCSSPTCCRTRPASPTSSPSSVRCSTPSPAPTATLTGRSTLSSGSHPRSAIEMPDIGSVASHLLGSRCGYLPPYIMVPGNDEQSGDDPQRLPPRLDPGLQDRRPRSLRSDVVTVNNLRPLSREHRRSPGKSSAPSRRVRPTPATVPPAA